MRLKLIRKTVAHHECDQARLATAVHKLVGAAELVLEDVLEPLSVEGLRLKTIQDLQFWTEACVDEQQEQTHQYVGMRMAGQDPPAPKTPPPEYTSAGKYVGLKFDEEFGTVTDWSKVPCNNWETEDVA